jgi:hypothetical protein
MEIPLASEDAHSSWPLFIGRFVVVVGHGLLFWEAAKQVWRDVRYLCGKRTGERAEGSFVGAGIPYFVPQDMKSPLLGNLKKLMAQNPEDPVAKKLKELGVN